MIVYYYPAMMSTARRAKMAPKELLCRLRKLGYHLSKEELDEYYSGESDMPCTLLAYFCTVTGTTPNDFFRVLEEPDEV